MRKVIGFVSLGCAKFRGLLFDGVLIWAGILDI